MDSARVYKIKIRENILRQTIFTDRNIFVIVVVLSTSLVWKVLSETPIDLKIFISITLSGTALLIFTIKVDRQILIKLVPRIFNFWKSKKKIRY